jgi:hypothetical protein
MNNDTIRELQYWSVEAEKIMNRIVDSEKGNVKIRDLMGLYSAVSEICGIAVNAYDDLAKGENK